jgi:hypothetical protein
MAQAAEPPETGGEYGANPRRKNDVVARVESGAARHGDAHLRSEPQITLDVIDITSEPLRTTVHWDNAAYELYDPGYTVLLVRGERSEEP